ncbi:hypothetical protein, partial [uncultured Allobaculum sp.]|uniref:hypothetical protein n=1 Tax=uncultured Allobaculum sp. TaxID=1187017 RepID=UPI0026F165DB
LTETVRRSQKPENKTRPIEILARSGGFCRNASACGKETTVFGKDRIGKKSALFDGRENDCTGDSGVFDPNRVKCE